MRFADLLWVFSSIRVPPLKGRAHFFVKFLRKVMRFADLLWVFSSIRVPPLKGRAHFFLKFLRKLMHFADLLWVFSSAHIPPLKDWAHFFVKFLRKLMHFADLLWVFSSAHIPPLKGRAHFFLNFLWKLMRFADLFWVFAWVMCRPLRVELSFFPIRVHQNPIGASHKDGSHKARHSHGVLRRPFEFPHLSPPKSCTSESQRWFSWGMTVEAQVQDVWIRVKTCARPVRESEIPIVNYNNAHSEPQLNINAS
jgi:hypothetical protein